MRSGLLRHKLTIEALTRTPDEMGGASVSWGTFVEVWGSVVPLSAREIAFAEKREHNVTHKITIRFTDGITTDMRVVHKTRVFQIRGITNPDERNIQLELTCEEGVAS